MKTLSYTVKFLTPAFLGNAEQNAQWRTPPFKALLRQWWRVAYAADLGFKVDLAAMRREEGLLFGHAWLENDTFKRDSKEVKTAARKSLVRIRLEMPSGQTGSVWGMGTQQGVTPLSTGLETGYAWFGLVKRGSEPDRNAIAIKSDEASRKLVLAVPDAEAERMETTLRLIHQFGQLGSRSRGGWGSFTLEPLKDFSREELAKLTQPLNDCLRHDWSMSLCRDKNGICLWESKSTFPSWDKAMRVVALERRNVRTALKSFKGRDLRPVLGFATPGRMPSPLRWRLTPAALGQLGITLFAMPTLIPEVGRQRINDDQTLDAWQEVIRNLDTSPSFHRTARSPS